MCRTAVYDVWDIVDQEESRRVTATCCADPRPAFRAKQDEPRPFLFLTHDQLRN